MKNQRSTLNEPIKATYYNGTKPAVFCEILEIQVYKNQLMFLINCSYGQRRVKPNEVFHSIEELIKH